jgi:hypothetical protein
MVVVYFLQFYFARIPMWHQAKAWEAKAWERICRRELSGDEASTRIHNLFLSTSQIAPIGGTTIEVKARLHLLLQLQE